MEHSSKWKEIQRDRGKKSDMLWNHDKREAGALRLNLSWFVSNSIIKCLLFVKLESYSLFILFLRPNRFSVERVS